MADPTDFKREHIIDTSGKSETSIGTAIKDDQGRYGFANANDESPYLPAGGEAVFNKQEVVDSLTFKEHKFGSHLKTRETVESKRLISQTQKNHGKDSVENENTIEAVKVKNHSRTETVSASPRLEGIEKDQLFSPAEGETNKLVPKEVKDKFVQSGNSFYFKGSDDRLAFKDTGNKLKTKIDGDQIADSMIAIAKNRGWSEIKVTGTETFKKDIWKKAAEQGIAVRGYTPTKVEQAELENKGVEIPKQGQSLSPEKSTLTPEQERAKAFKELSGTDAVKKHPELAPYVAAVTAIQKKVESENLSDANKKAVIERVRMNAVNSINQGAVPSVTIKQSQKIKTAQAELSR